MKKTIVFVALLMVANLAFAQTESDKTLVKTMDPQGTSSISFDFRNKGVESEPWDEGFIRVELEITANFPEAVLAQLVKAGRYTLTSEVQGEVFNIKAANLDKAVSIGGKDLDDQVRVYIQTPGYYAVADGVLQKNFPSDVVQTMVDRAGSMEEAKETLKKLSMIKEKVDVKYRFVYKKVEETKKAADPKTASKTTSKTTLTAENEKGALTPDSTLKEVEARYGDIIFGGMRLDNFKD